MGEYKYWEEEGKRKCGVCKREEGTWGHVLDRCRDAGDGRAIEKGIRKFWMTMDWGKMGGGVEQEEG